MRRLLPGLLWQQGAASLPMRRGDIVVVSGAPRCLSNLVILIRARLRGARTIWWGHYWSASSKPWRFALRLMLMRFSHGILFYTDAEVEEFLTTRNRIDSRPLVGLNNGINIDPIRAVRAPYHVKERSKRLLFIGRLTEKTEFSLLLRALADPALAAVELDVIGDGVLERRVCAEAEDLGLEARVHWHGGISNEAQIAAIANKVALFVYPGAVGLSLLHAMAYGLPAILHDDRWGHMPEISAFKDGFTGRSFFRGNAEALAQAIHTALNDTEACNHWSEAAILQVEQNYNTEEMAKRFCALIKELAPAIIDSRGD